MLSQSNQVRELPITRPASSGVVATRVGKSFYLLENFPWNLNSSLSELFVGRLFWKPSANRTGIRLL